MAERGRRGSYYNAPTEIRDVPGLVTKKDDSHYDVYSGSAEAIIAAGLLDADLLPGRPGRNRTSQSYRPRGVERLSGEWWHNVPGYMHVALGSTGYAIRLTVSREERAERENRRRAEEEAFDREGKFRRESSQAAAKATAIADCIRGGAEAWRERALKRANVWLGFAADEIKGIGVCSNRGMRLSDRDIESFDALARRLELLVRNAEIVIDHEAEAEAEASRQILAISQRRSAPLRMAWSAPT